MSAPRFITWDAHDPDVVAPPGYTIIFARTELTATGYRAPLVRGKRERCPKCGSGMSHRCKTGDCRHCNACDHAWLPSLGAAS